uniref:PDDEXK_1 domain-containing protein n=1 Tax=Panagrellus redivivus TaxID=6233 RepID=A0A7E4VA95_PANRE
MAAAGFRSIRFGTALTPSTAKVIDKLPNALKPWQPAVFGEKKDEFCKNFENSTRFADPPKTSKGYPSVSTLIGATDDLQKLYDWQCRTIKQMGGFPQFREHMTKRQRSGTNFHKVVKMLLDELQKSGTLSDEASKAVIAKNSHEENRGYVTGLLPVLQQLRNVDYMCMERKATNYYYCYQGRFDAIVELDGEPTLVDWKTASAASVKSSGDTSLENLYGNPIQIAAYINAVNTDPAWKHLPKITRGAVVLAFEDGRPAQIVKLEANDVKRYTDAFAERLNKFWYTVLNPEPGQIDVSNNVNFVYNPMLRPTTTVPTEGLAAAV